MDNGQTEMTGGQLSRFDAASSASLGGPKNPVALKNEVTAPRSKSFSDYNPQDDTAETSFDEMLNERKQLDVDVEKLFEMPVKFDLDHLHASEVTDAKGKFSDSDYADHRRNSMHIHHPLAGMSSKKMRKTRRSKPRTSLRTKRRKKRRSLKTDTSLPSRGAITHPSIPETGETESSPGSDSADEYYDQSPAIDEVSDAEDSARPGFFIGDRRPSEVSCENEAVIQPETVRDLPSNDQVENQTDKTDGQPPQTVKFILGGATSDHALLPEQQSSTKLDRPTKSADSLANHRHHKEHFKKEDLMLRRQKGSEVHMDTMIHRVPTEVDEAKLLHSADLDDMASHRLEDVRGIRRHKIQPKHNLSALSNVLLRHRKPAKAALDHTRHELFVEMDELRNVDGVDGVQEWQETARWIKFEEDLDERADRWGRAHVASLSFHSLIELRRGLEKGTMLFDVDAEDVPQLMEIIADKMIQDDFVSPDHKASLVDLLLLRHRHVNERKPIFSAAMKRNDTYVNLQTLDAPAAGVGAESGQSALADHDAGDHQAPHETSKDKDEKSMRLQLMTSASTTDANPNVHVGINVPIEDAKGANNILKILPKDTEASHIFVGQTELLSDTVVVFVRLSKGMIMSGMSELPTIPIRFLFFVLGPENCTSESHEVGRSMATLMSNQTFNSVAYKAESRGEVLTAINRFLDVSIVLPPGDWDSKTLLPIMDMARQRAAKRAVRKQPSLERKKQPDPLKRVKMPFGGLINDIKRRYPYYKSDITDAFNLQCVAAFIFIFFACLSPTIAFGGLVGDKTKGEMGVVETILATSIIGIGYSLLSAQPLIIIGYSGPVLLFEEMMYQFCVDNKIEFLALRVWVGVWMFVICTIVVGLQGSFLVRYVTRFTEELFVMLISLIFIVAVVTKLLDIFERHPLLESYCIGGESSNETGIVHTNATIHPIDDTFFNSTGFIPGTSGSSGGNSSDPFVDDLYHASLVRSGQQLPATVDVIRAEKQPNTALLSTILCLGTFLIAYFLKEFRNSHFFGRSVRRMLGDFGVPIAILIMVLIDFFIKYTYTQKLDVPEGLKPTSKTRKTWFIDPVKGVLLWQMFACILPAFLLFILMFMETQITEVILTKKERKTCKGPGFHLDMFLIGVAALVSGFFGMPFLCAATVRSVTHMSALTVMENQAPGEKPKITGVKEQRMTNFFVSVFIGLSLLMGPILRKIPIAVLFGIFLYMGICSMSGVQMYERIKLLFMSGKHHPNVGYVRHVRTFKMNVFTCIQITCLAILWAVKSSPISLAFPFFLMLLVPLRMKGLQLYFTESDLHQLDKDEGAEEEDPNMDDDDFYQLAHMPV